MLSLTSHTKSIDPSLLTIHPALKDMPGWAEDDPQYDALALDIGKRGIDQPLKVTGRGEIVDGRHRLGGALRAKLPSIPIDVIADEAITSIILQSILQRRHYTRGALAYMAVPIVRASHKPGDSKSVAILAAECGVNERAFYQANEVFDIFAKDPEFKAGAEPSLLDGEIGLGAILAGYAGKLATQGSAKKKTAISEHWDRAFSGLQSKFLTWTKLKPEDKNFVFTRLRGFTEALPSELVKKLQTNLAAELKRRKKEKGVAVDVTRI